MPKYIVIPLYDHTTAAEAAEIVSELQGHMQFSVAPYVAEGETPERGIQVHTFFDTGEAYDASQCRDEIKDGDVLVVPSEGVVGVMVEAWPTAVTEACGHFHTLDPSYSWSRIEPVAQDGSHDYSLSAATAMQIAKGLGAQVHGS